MQRPDRPTPEALDWNDLRHFLAAARALSLAGAARELQVEHSTVGRRLRSLERALGGTLVLRQPDGLVLTPLGLQVLAAAEQVERAVETVVEVAGGAQERVRLAVPSGFAVLVTAPLERLRQARPPIALDIVSGARVVDLARGDADLAVRGGPVTDLDLVARPLGHVGWALYAAPAYLQRRPPNPDPAGLAGHEVIGFDRSLSETPNARWLDAHATQARIVMRGAEVIDIAGAAAEGVGVALLPCLIGDRSPALQRMTPEVLVRRELALVYRREMRLSPAVVLAIEAIVEVFLQARALLDGAVGSAAAAGS